MHATLARPAVKSVVLFDSCYRSTDRTAGFAAGLAPAPVYSAPAAKPATLAEHLAHFRSTTLSPAEWAARRMEAACEAIDARLDAVYAGR